MAKKAVRRCVLERIGSVLQEIKQRQTAGQSYSYSAICKKYKTFKIPVYKELDLRGIDITDGFVKAIYYGYYKSYKRSLKSGNSQDPTEVGEGLFDRIEYMDKKPEVDDTAAAQPEDIFGSDERVEVQHQRWLDHEKYLIITDHASIVLEILDESRGPYGVQAYICCLWVDQGWRRQRKASKLIGLAERMAHDLGYENVWLEWLEGEGELTTLEWYKRRGYVECATRAASKLLKKKL